MTVKELIEELQKFQQDLDVVFVYDGSDTFQYLEVGSVLLNMDTNEVVIDERK